MATHTVDWQKRKFRRKITGQLISYGVLVGLGFLFILPLAWMISTSLKPDKQIFVFPPVWLPSPIEWSHYRGALDFIPFLTYLKNTLIICVLATTGTLLSSSLIAYGFSRVEWPERDFFFIVALATMMLPYTVTMIPLYLIFNKIGWINTFRPLYVPAFFGTQAFYIFLLRQFFMSIPFEISDAAKIDGASEFDIFLQIILPLTKPALAVVALFRFIWAWNDFLAPLIYLKDESQYTLSLGLQQFQSAHITNWGMLMAAATMVVLPIIILFFFTQKTFIQGITVTGLKQ